MNRIMDYTLPSYRVYYIPFHRIQELNMTIWTKKPRGWNPTQFYGVVTNQYKLPGSLLNIQDSMESKASFFSWLK